MARNPKAVGWTTQLNLMLWLLQSQLELSVFPGENHLVLRTG